MIAFRNVPGPGIGRDSGLVGDSESEPEAGIDSRAGAVFLSHTSQDTSVAERIAVALRGAGIEVWLDRSELRGGVYHSLLVKLNFAE